MSSFKVKFDIRNYATVEADPAKGIVAREGILPSVREYQRYDEILNYKDGIAGNIEKCVWKKQPEPAIITQEYIQQEVTRILRTGIWIFIKDTPVWIPPNYYSFLQYFTTGGQPPQFRIKRLKHVYFKIAVRNNQRALGTYTIKNRQDGETTFAMNDCLWEVADGNMDFGMIGMQSKTRDTVMKSCWRTLIMGWNTYPQWLKKALYYDLRNGDRLAETMKFIREADLDDMGRDILITYGASTHNAFDSFNNMRRCVLDEINKWEECSFFSTFLNYEKFIAAGSSRKGLFDIFSSPADKNGKHNDEALAFWKGCALQLRDEYGNPIKENGRILTQNDIFQPYDIEDLLNGTTATRIFRYYSNPLDGIENEYDMWGDADPEAIRDYIMQRRASIPKEHLMGEIRANPLDESEMFGAFEGGGAWENAQGIKDRKIYLIGRRFKETTPPEPIKVFGNLEWKEGVKDSDVVFRMADTDTFDVMKARFCFSHMPKDKEPLISVFRPPVYVENCLGVDPIAKRYALGKNPSNGAAVNHKFRDLFNTGINKMPTMVYANRPHHANIFYEDMIRAAVFNRAMVQYENINDGIANYFEDRGYHEWLLPSLGHKRGSLHTGDAPSARGSFLDEIMGLIEGFTAIPPEEGMPYLLQNIWFTELLEDLLAFNPKDTHANDITMAWGQALFGAAKMLHQKIREKSLLNNNIMAYLLE